MTAWCVQRSDTRHLQFAVLRLRQCQLWEPWKILCEDAIGETRASLGMRCSHPLIDSLLAVRCRRLRRQSLFRKMHPKAVFDKLLMSDQKSRRATVETPHSRALKRLVRYWKGERQWNQMATEVTTNCDSDWSGDKETRTSSSAGGSHMFKSIHTQATDHCEKQRSSRSVRGGTRNISIEGNRVDAVSSRMHNETCVGDRCNGHRAHAPQTWNWPHETR